MTNKKLIAKNTLFLYLRLIIVTAISLYTSRVLLNALGITDFGLYGIVGGVVAIFASLRGMFATSIQRFLNFEMGGENDNESLRKIFSMGVTIHIILCLIVVVFAETIGLWFVNNKMIIPPERLSAANWVFQFSVGAVIMTLLNVPYDAVIIAHEKMNVFAYISIFDAVLKLSIVLLIPLFPFDQLQVYAVLIFAVTILIRLISMTYCRRHFPEARYVWGWDKGLFREMGGFAGWTFVGNFAFTLVNEGSNILLNIFGGTVANASRTIAYQVRSAVMSLTTNMQTAVNPQTTRLYAQERTDEVFDLLFLISKFSFFILFIACLPILWNTEYILRLWLGTVPEYSVGFVKLILVYSLIKVFLGSISTLFKASGKLKFFQIFDAAITLLTLPISYVLLKKGAPLNIIFVVMILMEAINVVAIVILAKKEVALPVKYYLQKVILPCLAVFTTSFILVYAIFYKFEVDGFLAFGINVLSIVLIVTLSICILGLSKKERSSVKSFIKRSRNGKN